MNRQLAEIDANEVILHGPRQSHIAWDKPS